MRFPKYIPTERGESGNLEAPFFSYNTPFLGFQFDTWFPETIRYIYPKFIFNNSIKSDS
jgi:hypothetical protein